MPILSYSYIVQGQDNLSNIPNNEKDKKLRG